jgi:hypothetical protein
LRDHRAFPAALGLQAIRRLATTPVIPANLLIVQLAMNVAVVILGTGLLLVVGAAVFDIPVPQDPVGFLAAFLLGTGSVFSLGLLAVAIARTSRSVGGLVLVAYLTPPGYKPCRTHGPAPARNRCSRPCWQCSPRASACWPPGWFAGSDRVPPIW